MENQYAIEMLNITKKFPGIIANDNITLQLRKGEIHALLGENGAGKSTLMSVLFGLYQPEEGEIHKDGRKVEIKDPNAFLFWTTSYLASSLTTTAFCKSRTPEKRLWSFPKNTVLPLTLMLS